MEAHMHVTPSSMRAGRLARIGLVIAIIGAFAASPASAATPLTSHGTVGDWSLTDTSTQPGGRCAYQGAAGTFYLDRIRVHGPTIYGTTSGLRSVGYRILLQHRTATGWKTTQRGKLISGAASLMQPVTLPASRVVRNPDKSPNTRRYRAVVKIIWWNQHARVQGVVKARLNHLRRSYDSSIGHACRARVPIPH
jgi:hypothetical protein